MSVEKMYQTMNELVLERIKRDRTAWKRQMHEASMPGAAARTGGEYYQPCKIRIRAGQEQPAENTGRNPPKNCIAAYLEKNCVRHGEKRIDIAYRSGLGKDEYDNFRSNAAWPDEDLLWKLFYGVMADYDGDIEEELDKWRQLNQRYWAEQVEFVPDGAPQLTQARGESEKNGKFRPEAAQHELLAYIYACLPDAYRSDQEVYRAARIAPVTWAQLRDNHYRHAWSEGVLVRAAHAAQMDEAETRRLFELAVSCRTLRGYMMEAVILMEEHPDDPDDILWIMLTKWFRQGLDRLAKEKTPKKPGAGKKYEDGTLENKIAPILLRWKDTEDEEEFQVQMEV